MKTSKEFLVTLGPVDYYACIRQDFLCNFECVETYCVSIEKYHINNKVHIHCFLKLKVGAYLSEVRDCLSWFEGSLDVQSVRSRRNVLKYITKEDTEAVFNCRVGELSFAYRSYHWAKSTRTFRFSDPFVLEHPQYYRVLRELHQEVACRSPCLVPNKCIVEEFWPGWAMECLLQVYRQLWSGEFRALYVYGRPGVGKTFTIQCVFKALGLLSVFMPVPGTFFFGDFNPGHYDCVMFEEWDFKVFSSNYPVIKRIIDRRFFSVDCKQSFPRKFRVKQPIVFISNFPPHLDRAFTRRLELVEALSSLENVPKIKVPKMEVDGAEEEEMECIEIDTTSSDSENEDVWSSSLLSKTEKVKVSKGSQRPVLQERNNGLSNDSGASSSKESCFEVSR